MLQQGLNFLANINPLPSPLPTLNIKISLMSMIWFGRAANVEGVKVHFVMFYTVVLFSKKIVLYFLALSVHYVFDDSNP